MRSFLLSRSAPATDPVADGSNGDMMIISRAEYHELMALAAQARSQRQAAAADVPQAVLDAIEQGVSTLTAWREHRGLSQSELARLSGIHRITILRLESAGFGAGGQTTRRRIADALGAPLSTI